MRLFVAIDVPKAVKQELERLQHALQQLPVLTASYPQSDVIHLTLQFIGDVDEAVVPVIQEHLTHVAGTHDYAQLDALIFFIGHLILVRVKIIEDRERLLDFLGTLVVDPVRFPIREFVLKQSVLSARGSLHTDVQVYPLLPP